MPTQKTVLVYEPGEKIETVHGEKLVVVRSETVPVKKNGQFTGEEQTRVLAENQAGQLCWFPVSKIKTQEEKPKKK